MFSASSNGPPNPTSGASSSAPHNLSHPLVLDIPTPGDFTPGLEERFPDLLPPCAFYLAEVIAPAMTPADLVALKELVETDGGASLRLKRAWVPFSRCPSGVLPLDVHEALSNSGILSEGPIPSSSSLKREALESAQVVHEQSSFRPRRSRRGQTLPVSEDVKSSTATSCSFSSMESGQSNASYLSFTYVPEVGQYKCRRHFHDGSREDCGCTALVEPEAAPKTDP